MAEKLIGLHNLKSSPGGRKKKVRKGRGNSSGKGTYSGRGQKGQRARSGGKSGLKIRGARGYLLRIPKTRGFKSGQPAKVVINLDVLENNFSDNEMVSLKTLTKKGLIDKGEKNVKILGNGKLNKKLKVKIDNLSESAKQAIIKAGGSVEAPKQKDFEIKSVKEEKSK